MKAIESITEPRRETGSGIRTLKLGGCPLLSRGAVREACTSMPLLELIDVEGAPKTLKEAVSAPPQAQLRRDPVTRLSHPCEGSWKPEKQSQWAVQCPEIALRHPVEVQNSEAMKRRTEAHIRAQRERDRCKKLNLIQSPTNLESLVQNRKQKHELAAFREPVVAARAIMVLCDRTRRVGTVTATELRVGLKNTPYSPLLEFLGLVSEGLRAQSSFRNFRNYATNASQKGQLDEKQITKAVSDLKNALEPSVVDQRRAQLPNQRKPFEPTGSVAVRRRFHSLESHKRRHRASGCNCKNPACEEGQKKVHMSPDPSQKHE